MKFCSVSPKLSMRSCEKTCLQQKIINSFLLFKRENASMRFMYQSVPSVTIQTTQANFQNLPNLSHRSKFFGQTPGGRASLGSPYFNKFCTFSPFLRPQSLICPSNIYRFVGRTYITNEKYVKIVLICISYWLTFRSNALP